MKIYFYNTTTLNVYNNVVNIFLIYPTSLKETFGAAYAIAMLL